MRSEQLYGVERLSTWRIILGLAKLSPSTSHSCVLTATTNAFIYTAYLCVREHRDDGGQQKGEPREYCSEMHDEH